MVAGDRSQDPFEHCAHCGDELETGVRYPVETQWNSDGEVELYSFCGEACQRAWNEGDD